MRIPGVSRSFLRRILLWLGVMAVIAGLCLLDGYCIEPYFPRVIRQDVRIEGLPADLDGLKIVHLSDLHIVRLGKREERALRLIERVKPDIICLTGDYVEDDGITPGEYTTEDCTNEAARFMGRLHAKHGVHGVGGNWDPLDVTPFERAGVRMIDEELVTLNIGAARLNLAGTRAVEARAGSAQARLDSDVPTIVLDHFPEVADDLEKLDARVDLVLAGHWHGGQVGWPLKMTKVQYVAGLYEVGSAQLYVTRGLGMHSLAVRFNCPAEVTLITLRPSK